MSKLIRIPYQNLPDFNAITESYNIRYRLKSDDGNRVSAWSPIYGINPQFTYPSPKTMIVQKEPSYTTLAWEPIKVRDAQNNDVATLPYYDLWVRYSLTEGAMGTWVYRERVASTSLNIYTATLPGMVGIDLQKYISIEVYAPTVQGPTMKRRMFDVMQDNQQVDLTNNTITFEQDIDFVTGELIKYTVNNIYLGNDYNYQPTGTELEPLVNGGEYYVRVVGTNTIALYYDKQDAINDEKRIDFTNLHNSVGYFAVKSCTLCNYLLYGYYYVGI